MLLRVVTHLQKLKQTQTEVKKYYILPSPNRKSLHTCTCTCSFMCTSINVNHSCIVQFCTNQYFDPSSKRPIEKFLCKRIGNRWPHIFLYMSLKASFIVHVLVDLNEFPPIFQKVQHSHSRHQKTTSNLLRINLKGKLRFNNSWPLGAMHVKM